ncbi:helix-turn-helix domain-containing protein [Streptomyces sp. NPDC127051]|uniref:helix-turn-helix domain-containing protein n=1 Tax=Streptomyces sp. NPDC127051 TaxID=3347119 RepID=UPI0036613223
MFERWTEQPQRSHLPQCASLPPSKGAESFYLGRYRAGMRSVNEAVRRQFGKLIADAARATGRYDLDSHGGKAALARAAGLSESTMGRVLRGESIPDPRFFEPLAAAVNLDVRDLLIEVGIVSPESLSTQVQNKPSGVGSDSITLDEAANALGLSDPVAREMLRAAVERQQRQDAERDADDGGGAAAQG